MRKGIISALLKSNSILRIAAILYSLPSYCFIKGRLSNKIVLKGAFLKKTRIRLNGKNNSIKISSENQLNNCLIHISGNNCKIEIGRHCVLSNLELWIEDDGGSINIGYHTSIEGGHIAATEGQSICIGEDCMFSHGIEIRNGDSHTILDRETNQRINAARSVIIGNHCWLGADAKVLKGSVIEDGCVIATGAIITGITDVNSIYAGIPSKKVKENIIWLRER
jgi:acetyltransferase-like isoleucine patch superfamily enzyme